MGVDENRLLEFVDAMADLLHDATRPFYRKRSEYPVDADALYENSLLSTALYDRYLGIKPTIEQATLVSSEAGSYQRLLERYGESSDQPTAAIAEYCGAMNGVLDERAYSKGKSHFVMTPNLFGYAGRIEELLREYRNKYKNTFDKKRVL